MSLRALTHTTLLILTAMLAACINTSTNNPDQPSTIKPPQEETPPPPVVTSPPPLPPSGFKAITAGGSHSCAARNKDGALSCWGNNTLGQSGRTQTANINNPSTISQGPLWQSISGGYTHTCGVAIDEQPDPANIAHKIQLHRLYCWGDNSRGAVGYGTTTAAYYEPTVLADDDWSTVSAGNGHSCAIRLDKSLWCWGDNSNGQLGHIPADHKSPSQVDSHRAWSGINASDQFTCGLKEDQSLWCWGSNDKYQFGNGTTTGSPSPQQIGSDWDVIATGQAHICGIKTDGTLWCWGDNGYGQIGTGNTLTQTTPFQVTANSGAITLWSGVTAGHQHTCAIAKDDQSLWCWGSNETGQLGIGSTAHQARPAKVSHAKGWLAVTAGGGHTCAVDKADVLHCWGSNLKGQDGIGVDTNTELPRLYDTSNNWHTLDSGYQHSCGLKGERSPFTLWCSGFNNYGQIGIGSPSNQATLVQIKANQNNSIISGWESLSIGPTHSCAIAINASNHPLFCWGNNSRGQLGDNATLENSPKHWWPSSNSQVFTGSGPEEDWVMVAAGNNNSCGIKGASQLWCWGDNSSGQMANGVFSQPSDPPFLPTHIPGSWLSVTVGGPEGNGGHICAIKTDGTLWCWGKNNRSQLGNGAALDRATPVQIGTETSWVTVKAGELHTCALKSNNTLWCWGDNGSGRTGTPQVNSHYLETVPAPTQESGNYTWLDFDLGSNVTCGIRSNKTVRCWGSNSFKQLTSRWGAEAFGPVEVQGAQEWLRITVGQRHVCAMRENPDNLDRQAYCWGERAQYQFGNDSAWKTVPQALPLK